MRMRWWFFTIVIFAGATFFAMQSSDHPQYPGATYRWYDGSLEKIENFNGYTGKLSRRVLFGDDGKSILSDQRYNQEGVLNYSMIRLDDGRLEEKTYSQNGVLLIRWDIFAGDGKTLLLSRVYDGGIMQSEQTFSEKPYFQLSLKLFWRDGSLKVDQRFDKNGSVVETHYRLGGTSMRAQKAIKLNGEGEQKDYFKDGKTVARLLEVTQDFLRTTYFNTDGSLARVFYKQKSDNGRENLLMEVSSYESGRPVYRQIWLTTSAGFDALQRVDIYDEKGMLKQAVQVKRTDKGYEPESVADYDKDGVPSVKRPVTEKDSFKDSYFVFPDQHGIEQELETE